MNKGKSLADLQSIVLGTCVIICALIGIFYTNGGKSFEVLNMYGDTVKIYGDGIYAYNSILNVSSRLGADVIGIIQGSLLIFLTLWKNKPLWAKILKASGTICLAYYSSLLVFGLSMNRLYFLYAFCFGIGLFSSFKEINNLYNMITVPEVLKEKTLKGTGVFLIAAGVITALVWISCVLPVTINGHFGSLLGIQTNEITYGIDFGITIPLLILCGIWVLRKKDIGYKTAPLLLYVLVFVAFLVIFQRAYCIKLGVEIPVQALISLIISFVVLGAIALCLFVKLISKLRENTVF